MTDNPGDFFGGIFGTPPPEVVEALRARRAAHFMALEDTKNKLEGLFGELDLDHLTILREMLLEISSAGPKAETIADYWLGWASSVLKFKHGVCSSCGNDHENEDLMKMVKEAGATPPAGDEPQVMQDVALDKFREMTPDEEALMKEYHLDDARIEGTNELVGFICTGITGGPVGGCGLVYVSIEDRMLKSPEDCHGCFSKAAHG